jgi:hypothetical protein
MDLLGMLLLASWLERGGMCSAVITTMQPAARQVVWYQTVCSQQHVPHIAVSHVV